jgi:hypothetical protein
MVKKKMDLSALMLIKDELFYTGEQLNWIRFKRIIFLFSMHLIVTRQYTK